MSRVFPVSIIVCLTLAACSKYLEVRIFNGASEPIRVCSLPGVVDCINVLPGLANGVMSWKQGQFTLETTGCIRYYQVPTVANLDTFRTSRTEPVNVVISQSYELWLVPNGKEPATSPAGDQPTGFPVAPVNRGPTCK